MIMMIIIISIIVAIIWSFLALLFFPLTAIFVSTLQPHFSPTPYHHHHHPCHHHHDHHHHHHPFRHHHHHHPCHHLIITPSLLSSLTHHHDHQHHHKNKSIQFLPHPYLSPPLGIWACLNTNNRFFEMIITTIMMILPLCFWGWPSHQHNFDNPTCFKITCISLSTQFW